MLSANAVESYAKALNACEPQGEKSVVMKLYYCGSKEKPERQKLILKHGFSEEGKLLIFIS